ncbi:MAG TPA: hypothetical protein VGH30_08245, partial [Jatrophihabitantaceae bacterium]
MTLELTRTRDEQQVTREPGHRRRAPRDTAPWAWLVATAMVAVFGIAVPYLHWLTPVFGLAVTIGVPVTMFAAKLRLPGSPLADRVIISVALTVLVLMAGGLLLNTVLPHLGEPHPLGRWPVTAEVLAIDAAVILWRRERTPALRLHAVAVRPSVAALWAVLAVSLLACVVGANRLNNGASGNITLISFGLLIVAVCMLWRLRNELSDGHIATVLYVAALILLLATSLRGWYITGHDIQREFHVFEITYDAQRWNISSFQNSYNACLSLTVLPDIYAHLLGMDTAYVFKVIDQAFFAMAPAAVYLISRKQFSRETAILAVLFFVSFPTFFTDLPFITRQEAGFTFLAVALLVLVCDTWSHVGRVFWFLLFGVAIILTHYSTTYILLITLGAAWLLRVLARGVRFAVRRRRSALSVDRRRAVAGLSVIGALVALAALWTGPLTHTSSQLEQTVSATVNELFGTGSASRSTDVAYGLFHSQVLTPDQELQQYRKQTIAQDDPTRLSPATVNKYPIKAVPQPDEKFTALGNRLDQA